MPKSLTATQFIHRALVTQLLEAAARSEWLLDHFVFDGVVADTHNTKPVQPNSGAANQAYALVLWNRFSRRLGLSENVALTFHAQHGDRFAAVYLHPANGDPESLIADWETDYPEFSAIVDNIYLK